MSQRQDPITDEKAAFEAIIAADEEPLSGALTDSYPVGPAALHSTIWTVAGFAIMHVLRFGFNVSFTHIVEPRIIGVMTIIDLFVLGLHMFSDFGLRQCVVNSTRGYDRQFLNTAWTIQVVRGTFLWVATAALAWPVGRFYNINEMYWLMPIVGLTAFFDGLTSTAAMTMSRELKRGAIVIREIASYLASNALIILWILAIKWRANAPASADGSEMFAFAVGKVFSNALEMALSYTLIRGATNWFAWDKSAVRELWHFGGWIFVSTACTYLAANFDRLFVGKLSSETLAFYGIAATIVRTPTLLMALMGYHVLYPLYSRVGRKDGQLAVTFPFVHAAMNGVAAWVVAGVITSGPTLINLAYPAIYEPAKGFILGLGIAAWFTVLQTSSEVVLVALAQTKQVAIGQVIKLVLLLPLMFLGFHYYGIQGVIYGYAIAEAARYIVLSVAVARAGMPVFRLDLVLSGLVVISILLTQLIGPYLEAQGGKFAQYGVRLVGEIVFMTTFWVCVLALWWPRHGRQLVALLWQKQ